MDRYCVCIEASIRDAMKKIDTNLTSSAVVVDGGGSVVGVITDGDIRRALLRGGTLEDNIEGVYNKNITALNYDCGKRKAKDIMLKKKIRQLPILGENRRISKFYFLDDILSYEEKKEWVVIQAGGLGSRLGELTKNTPKPLLNIGDKPVLEHIIEGFKYFGFKRFIITLNYKGHMIEEYFGDGDRFGADIRYVKEESPLGTAGSLFLCKDIIDTEDIIMVNGDVLTGLDFERFLQYHKENENAITVGALEQIIQIPFGVIEIEDNRILGLKEKPKFEYFINSGIYVIKRDVIDIIDGEKYIDMPTVIQQGKEQGYKEMIYPIKEYWRDIGKIEEYERTNVEAYKLV